MNEKSWADEVRDYNFAIFMLRRIMRNWCVMTLANDDTITQRELTDSLEHKVKVELDGELSYDESPFSETLAAMIDDVASRVYQSRKVPS